ncbi:MAG: hypothetical protein KKA16_04415 [Alphaproteobacteria bacterium]|nr:hypothetical protein [Alphaproteobacteria bacterium]MBU2380024.1 hypothetical protein [Alphaproteobacteria bacterium]
MRAFTHGWWRLDEVCVKINGEMHDLWRAAFHNHFSQDRHLISRETYKAQCSAALAEWQTLAA